VDYISAFDPSDFPCKVAAEVRDFRPGDYISAKHVRTMGRFSQFAVASARLALEDAGLETMSPLLHDASIACGASGGGDVFETATRALLESGVRGIKPWTALEYPPHTAASYVAIEFGIHGPNLSLTSNCCSGLDSLASAFGQIVSQRSRVAVAVGCDAPIFPAPFATFCALGSLTTRDCPPAQSSRPYDKLRDGLVISEGGGALVLEDLELALKRDARIYAEVLGQASGGEAVGMRKGDLTGGVMASAITTAIRRAGLAPKDIDHINAHGSSLPDFDICDSKAFKLSLGTHAYSVPITSIKSMVGQPFSAAGALQAISACLSIQNHRVPPTVNQEVRDPDCDLDYVPNISRVACVRHVLINAHSFGGNVSAIVLGPPPASERFA
jgi:3-oxoacyl-[acyl-carrier-protein] synthase II